MEIIEVWWIVVNMLKHSYPKVLIDYELNYLVRIVCSPTYSSDPPLDVDGCLTTSVPRINIL